MTKEIFNALGMRGPAFFIASAWTRLKEARATDSAGGRHVRPARFTQRPITGALALSLLFHGALVAALVFSFGQKAVRHDDMIRVSLVDDLPSGAAPSGKAGRSIEAAAVVREVPRGTSRALAREKKDRMFFPPSLPATSLQPALIEQAVSEKPVVSREAVPVTDATSPAPRAAAPDLPENSGGNAKGMDYVAKGGSASGTPGYGTGGGIGGAGRGAGTGSGTGGSGTGSGQATYLREHFVYIRDLIMKNLKYPATARRLGWKGAVTVSFVVLENGATRDIKIIKSSGHDILDQAVIQTIQQTQPFPKPPVKAELTIPIVFQLKAGSG